MSRFGLHQLRRFYFYALPLLVRRKRPPAPPAEPVTTYEPETAFGTPESLARILEDNDIDR
jgi:hypothetical protein